VILPIPASQVAKITGVSHHAQLLLVVYSLNLNPNHGSIWNLSWCSGGEQIQHFGFQIVPTVFITKPIFLSLM
jgi:hypothetical protein